MKKVALILADGFEEIEALTVVDVLRRAGMTCNMLGFSPFVTGSRGIVVKADALWQGDLEAYDMVVLPGGMPGATNLRDDQLLMTALKQMQEKGKYVAAICAAPLALAKAGILKERHFTCYDGTEEQIKDGHYQKETVVHDDKLITSRGPATALAFAYDLVDTLGGDADKLREAMLYKDVFDK